MCDEAEMKQIASIAAKEAVDETFTKLGIDVNDAASIRSFQANMGTMYKFRKNSEKVGMAVILTTVTLLTGGFLKIAWDAMKSRSGG